MKENGSPPMAVHLLDAPQAIEQVTRGEVEIQAMLAIRNPRDPERAIQRTLAEATADIDIAASCFYAVRKGGDLIEGPSVRLTEIAGRCWGNMRCGSRIVDVGDTMVTAQGYAWDLETNFVVYQERQRRITNRHGARYGDDMIVTTANAAASISFREAVIKVIGKTKLDKISQTCKQVALGDTTSMADKWQHWVDFIAKASIDEERILLALGLKRKAEVTPEDLIKLQGFITAIREGESTAEAIFPPLEDPSTAVPPAGTTNFGGKRAKDVPRETSPEKAPESTESPPSGEPPAGAPTKPDLPPSGQPQDDSEPTEEEPPPMTQAELEAAGQGKITGPGF